MRHDQRDARDAYARRPPGTPWHPLLAAEERSVGVWVMVAQYGREYGTVRLVRRGTEVGYRADDAAGELLGYYRTLRAACEAVHKRFLRQHRPSADWPNNDGQLKSGR